MSDGRNVGSTAKPLEEDLDAPRFPPPPRAPSLSGGPRSASGTQPRSGTESSPAALEQPVLHRSGPSPAHTHAFRAEEPPSFDKRLTPVVPASWPEHEASTAKAPRVALEPAAVSTSEPPPLISVKPAADIEVMPTPSQKTPSISLAPASGEHAFWEAAPKYSVAPERLITDPPRAVPSRGRAWLTRFLFVAVVGVVLGLLYYEASIAYHVPWRNPGLLVERIRFG
jgi:hypothetical protein